MKGYYIYFERKDQYGVRKKIAGQLRAMRSFADVEEINVLEKSLSTIAKIRARIPFFGFGYDYTTALNNISEPDFLYIRHTMVDQDYINFLRNIKVKFPKAKVIVELYTYPYDKDFYYGKTMWPLYIKEVLFRGQLKKYIDRFVTLTDDDEIFGVKTIKTVNGIDLDTVSIRMRNEKTDDTIRLISVAVMQKHHGFERLIEGLHQYYKNGGTRNIIYTVVGDTVGPEVEKYINLTKTYELSDHVLFVGQKRGEELETLMQSADIGICSLGSYKLGIEASSQLKSREYLATGMPMLTGCKIDVLENTSFPYYVEYPNDPSSIDIDRLIEFYERTYVESGKTRNEIAKEIREFAEKTIDVRKVMEPVHEYILSK